MQIGEEDTTHGVVWKFTCKYVELHDTLTTAKYVIESTYTSYSRTLKLLLKECTSLLLTSPDVASLASVTNNIDFHLRCLRQRANAQVFSESKPPGTFNKVYEYLDSLLPANGRSPMGRGSVHWTTKGHTTIRTSSGEIVVVPEATFALISESSCIKVRIYQRNDYSMIITKSGRADYTLGGTDQMLAFLSAMQESPADVIRQLTTMGAITHSGSSTPAAAGYYVSVVLMDSGDVVYIPAEFARKCSVIVNMLEDTDDMPVIGSVISMDVLTYILLYFKNGDARSTMPRTLGVEMIRGMDFLGYEKELMADALKMLECHFHLMTDEELAPYMCGNEQEESHTRPVKRVKVSFDYVSE